MKVNKDLLTQEKMIYGDNFEPVCERWSKYLGIKITPKDVAMMMADEKDTRVKHIQNQLNDLKEKPGFLIDNNLQELYGMFKSALDENLQKRTHFLFIATNFDEYLNL